MGLLGVTYCQVSLALGCKVTALLWGSEMLATVARVRLMAGDVCLTKGWGMMEDYTLGPSSIAAARR